MATKEAFAVLRGKYAGLSKKLAALEAENQLLRVHRDNPETAIQHQIDAIKLAALEQAYADLLIHNNKIEHQLR